MSSNESDDKNQEIREEKPLIMQLLAKKIKSFMSSDNYAEFDIETDELKQDTTINTNDYSTAPALSITVNVNGIEGAKISSVTLDTDNSLTLNLSLNNRRL